MQARWLLLAAYRPDITTARCVPCVYLGLQTHAAALLRRLRMRPFKRKPLLKRPVRNICSDVYLIKRKRESVPVYFRFSFLT